MAMNFTVARLPALPAPEFFQNPTYTICTAGGDALLSYDPSTRAGFVYAIKSGTWQIAAPVDFYAFLHLVAAAGLRVAPSADARTWLQACDEGADVAGDPGGMH